MAWGVKVVLEGGDSGGSGDQLELDLLWYEDLLVSAVRGPPDLVDGPNWLSLDCYLSLLSGTGGISQSRNKKG